jgi:hypothetical protein
MKKLQIICNLATFAFVLIFFNLNIMAQEIQVTATEKPFTFKLTDKTDDRITEPSAVETIDKDGKYLLAADDKSDASPLNLRIIQASDGRVIKPFQIPDAPEKPKWEAITKDEQGFFYLIGSHAAKNGDNAAKLLARSHLYRFRLIMNEDPSKIDVDKSSITEFDIKSSLKELKIYTDNPSEENVKIEGLAFKTIEGKKHLIFGLSEPSALVQIYSAAFPTVEKKGEIIKLSLKLYFQFDAKTTSDKTPFKLSSIEYVPNWKGFLILTSSETTEKAANGKDKPVFHGNAIWFVSDEKIKASRPAKFSESIKPVEAQKVPEFEVKTMKAEGFCLMPTTDKKITRLAIVFDNDTEDMKKAEPDKFLVGMMQFIELLHKSP